jgi:hypothetical protein
MIELQRDATGKRFYMSGGKKVVIEASDDVTDEEIEEVLKARKKKLKSKKDKKGKKSKPKKKKKTDKKKKKKTKTDKKKKKKVVKKKKEKEDNKQIDSKIKEIAPSTTNKSASADQINEYNKSNILAGTDNNAIRSVPVVVQPSPAPSPTPAPTPTPTPTPQGNEVVLYGDKQNDKKREKFKIADLNNLDDSELVHVVNNHFPKIAERFNQLTRGMQSEVMDKDRTVNELSRSLADNERNNDEYHKQKLNQIDASFNIDKVKIEQEYRLLLGGIPEISIYEQLSKITEKDKSKRSSLMSLVNNALVQLGLKKLPKDTNFEGLMKEIKDNLLPKLNKKIEDKKKQLNEQQSEELNKLEKRKDADISDEDKRYNKLRNKAREKAEREAKERAESGQLVTIPEEEDEEENESGFGDINKDRSGVLDQSQQGPSNGSWDAKNASQLPVLSSSSDDEGLYSDEIVDIMKKYESFLGVFADDQYNQVASKVKPKSRGSIIVNTDPSTKEGTHWQAIYFDARPTGSKSIEFFDSFGRDPTANQLKGIKLISEKLKPDTYLKLKINKVKQQNVNSANCGYFSCRFLIDRYRGRSFAESTGYSDKIIEASKKGEQEISKFKKMYGGCECDFKYI